MKNVVLIRHGESLGQTANENGMSRRDKSLVDCFLTNRGVHQACKLRSNLTLMRYEFDLVCTSPLSRAIATCALALGHITEHCIETTAGGVCIRTTPFVAHSHISEAGTGIPENWGREIPVLKKDLKEKLSIIPSSGFCIDRIDYSLIPSSWPHVDNNLKLKQKLNLFLEWLMKREEKNVAIFCHYNIIRWFLGDAIDHVPNCMPFECYLLDGTSTSNPRLVLKSDYESGNIPI